MKICLIIVTYNTNNTLKKCLESLEKYNNIDVVIVDNYPESDALEILDESFLKQYSYHHPGENLGYSGGFKYGLGKLDKKYDFIIQSNADMVFTDINFFENMADSIKITSLGIYCPKILSTSSGSNQNPYLLEEPTRLWKFKFWLINNFDLFFKINTFLSSKKNVLRKKQSNFNNRFNKIFAPHGSFICYSSNFFEKGCEIETRNFLYYEEEILGFLCKNNNIDVIYDDHNIIYHQEHVSTSNFDLRSKRLHKKKSFDILTMSYFK
jgi:GT2 family glycosyltransferase